MLNLMTSLPDNVLGIVASGKVTGTDYETVLIPAVEEKLKSNNKVKLLYVLGSGFTEFDLAAVLDDSKIGMKHLFAWQKAAFVSDHELMNTMMKFMGYMLPCEVRIFDNNQLQEAIEWISAN